MKIKILFITLLLTMAVLPTIASISVPSEGTVYTAGIFPESWNWEILIPVVVLVLGLFAINWISLSGIAKKIGAASESFAHTGYQAAQSMLAIGLDKPSTIIKEGSEVVDELGDVAAVLAEKTADGKFSTEDAKAVLKEGKEVVVAFKDFWLVVKPKKE